MKTKQDEEEVAEEEVKKDKFDQTETNKEIFDQMKLGLYYRVVSDR